MSSEDSSIPSILNDISENIINLNIEISNNNYSNQLYDISYNIQTLNTKVNSILELYNILNDLKSRLNT
jgi:preprotein translocase subunit SecB